MNLIRPPRAGKNGRDRQHDRGFTLVEATVALALTLMAGTTILLTVETSLQTSESAVDEAIAAGMARQLIDEVLGAPYKEANVSAYQWPLQPSAFEAAGNGRERFDDMDDFNGYVASAAEDIWGQPLGTGDGQGGLRHDSFKVRQDYFANWRQEIGVYYVDDDNLDLRLPSGQTSSHRAVEVTILREMPDGSHRELATARRVVGYIPPPPSI